MTRSTKRWLGAATAAAVALSLAGVTYFAAASSSPLRSRNRERQDATPPATAGTLAGELTCALEEGRGVALEAFEGVIRVTPWDRAEVRIIASVFEGAPVDVAAGASFDFQTAERDGELIVSPGLFMGQAAPWPAQFEVSLPRTAALRAQCEEAALRVADHAAPIAFAIYSGHVRCERISAPIEGWLGAGRIEIESAADRVRVETSSAGVIIHADRPLPPGAAVTCKTLDGSVRMRFAGESAFDLAVSTLGGRVACEFPLVFAGEVSPQRFEARVGGGGVKVSVDTLDGPVEIGRSS